MPSYNSSNTFATSLLQFGKQHKLPVILQAESAECGLVCLAMILNFYGYETDLGSLRRKFNLSNRGISLKDLIKIASNVELSARALRLDIEDVGEISTHCILHCDLNHFVFLKRSFRAIQFTDDVEFNVRSYILR